jgi:hypothetical protein
MLTLTGKLDYARRPSVSSSSSCFHFHLDYCSTESLPSTTICSLNSPVKVMHLYPSHLCAPRTHSHFLHHYLRLHETVLETYSLDSVESQLNFLLNSADCPKNNSLTLPSPLGTCGPLSLQNAKIAIIESSFLINF